VPELKLGKLPDRTPVKITFAASPELDQALQDYAAIYRAAYGQAEAVAELVPFMLEAFLDGDRGFAKARKEGIEAPSQEILPAARSRRSRRMDEAVAPSITSTEE